jgi:hypothetical protein
MSLGTPAGPANTAVENKVRIATENFMLEDLKFLLLSVDN